MAKSKLPRSTPAARAAAVPPPKLAAAAQQQQQQQQQQPQQPPQPHTPSSPAPMKQPKAPVAGASTPPRSVSPVSNHDTDNATLSSAKKKKKKSKSKAKDSDFIDDHEYDLRSAAALGQSPRSPASLAARAQAQAQLLAAASELYRRIEGDAQGIPDDDAYWTSLPAHLRTFIRNALPLGQFPPAAQAALNENANDPANRHASTQAMIAVAQQLAQAAHASQRHLQQYPPGTHPYPPLPFDASIFADLALHPDQALPLHPHPNAANNVHPASNGSYAQYASSPNPPPTQPPGGPLPDPVVLYDNFDDEIEHYDDDGEDGAQYYDDGELDEDDEVLDAQGGLLRARERVWMQDGSDHAHGPHGILHPDGQRSASKNKKKKKKKKSGAGGAAGNGDEHAHEIEVIVPPPPKPVPNHPPPTTNVPSVARNSNPPPSSRAAGKQPMTFNSTGKAPTRPANGVPPSSNSGKRSVSSSTHGQQPAAHASSNNAKIWSTSSAEERERIKEFWLGLSMEDRQKLVQVEKETVLKKMKEQQKFLCSCAVCGRKRSAIEEELEVLYDAYYDELEEYANHQQRWASSGGTIPPPPGPGPFPGSVALDASGAVIGGDPLTRNRAANGGHVGRHTHPHPHGRKTPLHAESSDGYDDDGLDDDAEYEDEDDDADYDDEEDDVELDKDRARDDYPKRSSVPSTRRRGTNDAKDLFGLGSSLTVKGGILTVADDMLKNDGRKFLEMMEQLAERRMHREELSNAELAASDEGEDDVEGPDDVDVEDEDEDDEEEDEEDDILTEEQRMEEGRKMFQIFAARMFEQRVLAAYRERVAQERQLQLLRELEEEDTNEKAREARRMKESQKKKDKKKQQREAKEAEKMRKDQERAAAEAEERVKQQAQRDAELKKQEEIRLQREAERKAKEDEKAKKEEERRRRQAEEREREMERERKRREKEERARLEREAQEKAKRDREEAQRKAREEQQRAQREKAEKEQKAKEEQERKIDAAKKEKEARAQVQRESKQAASAGSQARGSAAAQAAPSSPSTGPKAVSAKATYALAHGTPARGAKNGYIPGSPAVAQGQAATRGANASRSAGAGAPRSAQNSTSGSAATGAAPAVTASATAAPLTSGVIASTLPAPPQGLPPRPSTAVLTPAGSSSQGSSVSVAANAGLPRPPVNAGSVSAVPPALGFGSIAPNASASVAVPVSKAPGASISPKPTQGFAQAQDKQPSPVGFGSPRPSSGAAYLQQPGLEGLRSPTLPNGMPSNGVFGSKAGMSSSLQSPGLAGPGLGGMANNLASFNLNAAPLSSSALSMGMPMVGSKASMSGMESSTPGGTPHGLSHSSLGGSLQSPTQTPFSPMGGSNTVDTMRSRTASFADSDPMSAFAGMRPGSSLSQRVPAYRSGAPTPIGPIGRPKTQDANQQHLHDDHAGAIGNGRSSSSASGSGATSPRHQEGILGSSALGGDDDIIDPKPRRVSHTIPIGGGASGSNMGTGGSFFGGMSSAGAVGGGFGVSSSSPWSSFSGSNQATSGPLSPSFNGGAPGPGSIGSSLASSNFGLNQSAGTSGLGSNPPGLSSGAPSDPWARVSAGWDRARYAFEQPGSNNVGGSSGANPAGLGGMGSSLHGGPQSHHGHGLGGHCGQLHHPMGLNGGQGSGSGNGNLNGNASMIGGFNLGAPGSGARNLFGAPGGNALHPGAIGSALSPTSPGARHISGSHE
ncbi:hypothetical protein NDA18_002535 [Ustilago nuda]|nr:hypothetical protein NDA18_002535 [Ustilago nuda]